MNFQDKVSGRNLVVVDVETSGLHSDGDNPAEMIEISAIKCKEWQEAESDMHPKSWTDFWRCIFLW